jgi:hypothetical protein
MLSDFEVCVYNGSFFNMTSRVFESCDFIYIGFIGFDNKRQNIILTNIEADNPIVRIVKRSDIVQHIMSGSVGSVSVQHLLNNMKKVQSAQGVPQIARVGWEKAYNVYLEQWVEGMYYEKCCKKIQKAWLNAVYDPSYVVCKQRLTKEFERFALEMAP